MFKGPPINSLFCSLNVRKQIVVVEEVRIVLCEQALRNPLSLTLRVDAMFGLKLELGKELIVIWPKPRNQCR